MKIVADRVIRFPTDNLFDRLAFLLSIHICYPRINSYWHCGALRISPEKFKEDSDLSLQFDNRPLVDFTKV